jgi:hypothetical protein
MATSHLLLLITLGLFSTLLLWVAPVALAGLVLREKGYTRLWLLPAVVPCLALPLLLVALCLRNRNDLPGETSSHWTRASHVAGAGLIVTSLFCGSVGILASQIPAVRVGLGLVPAEIPKLDDPQLTGQLTAVLADSPLFQSQREDLGAPRIVSLAETAYDAQAQRRQGRVIVRHLLGDEDLGFTVQWQDSSRNALAIVLDEPSLPSLKTPRLTPLIRKALRASPLFQQRQPELGELTVGEISESTFSVAEQRREGRVKVRHSQGEDDLRVVLEWRDRNQGQLQFLFDDAQLPAVKSPQVKLLLSQVIEGSPAFETEEGEAARPEVVTIDEVSFDAEGQRRKGLATIKTAEGLGEVRFTLDWRDRALGQLRVRIDTPELPAIDSPQVARMIRRFFESSPIWQVYREQYGKLEVLEATETGFDQAEQLRLGRAKLKHRRGSDEFHFAVVWLDRSKNQASVIPLPKAPKLPLVQSTEVAARIQGVLQESLARHEGRPGSGTVQIRDISELSFDETEQRRYGRARIRPGKEAEEVDVDFVIHWCGRDRQCWGVQLKSAELPPLDSQHVLHEVKHAIADSARFAERLETTGSPEVTEATQVLFDATAQKRVGRTKVRHAQGVEEVKFAIQWLDQGRGVWKVQVLDE